MNQEKIWNKLKSDSLSYQKSMDPLKRKQTGAYYTGLDLAYIMVDEMFSKISDIELQSLYNKKFLEPCVGSGNFVFAYLKKIYNLKCFSKENIETLIYNIYVCDIDNKALELYYNNLKNFVDEYFNINLKEEYKKNIGCGLIFNVLEEDMFYSSLEDIFPNKKFDIVITNPPYKNLKAELSHYKHNEFYELDKIRYKSIKNFIKEKFPLSSGGVTNLFKLFVEEILTNYTTEDSMISLLIPSSILTDKSCLKLRTHILTKNNLLSIINVPENNMYIDATQALTALLVKKGSITNTIDICKDIEDKGKQHISLNVDDILNPLTGNAIVMLDKKEYNIIEKMNKHPRLKELPFIHNLRGELDISLNKEYITDSPTNYVLLKGRNINQYFLNNLENQSYVLDDFVKTSSKKSYIHLERIICQQIVNVRKAHRLSFAKIDSGIVLANSCNFIYVDKNNDSIDLYYLLGLLNTKIMDWYFKQYSSNNHINNYELDALPIPIHDKSIMGKISYLVKLYLSDDSKDDILDRIENYVLTLFGINENNNLQQSDFIKNNFEAILYSKFSYIIDNIKKEDITDLTKNKLSMNTFCIKYGLDKFETNVVSGIYEKEQLKLNNILMNNTSFKMSNLDMEIIKSVQPGGNWKDIPQEVMNKSKRLLGIQKTGGRTTLYGRMDYSKPSYTITTYFNRPGNGTYIHPSHDRVISVREAARIQGFDDEYFFFGNQRQILNQIGNAVPPQIGYLIGRKIIEQTNCCKSIDLFSGAGGITSGLKKAGIKSLLCNDIEESACTTLKINNPETNVLCADICSTETKKIITKTAIEMGADIICGGPPCQGFSMAGFRDINDPRNQLFRDFVDIVSKIKPKIIVFENVQGILTLKKGEIYSEILQLFESLGYILEGKLLNFDDYGVPQKRKRVILIGTRKDINISPANLFPNKITVDNESKTTVYEAIGDLEEIKLDTKSKSPQESISTYVKLLKGEISAEQFYKTLINSIKNNDTKIKFDYEQLLLF